MQSLIWIVASGEFSSCFEQREIALQITRTWQVTVLELCEWYCTLPSFICKVSFSVSKKKFTPQFCICCGTGQQNTQPTDQALDPMMNLGTTNVHVVWRNTIKYQYFWSTVEFVSQYKKLHSVNEFFASAVLFQRIINCIEKSYRWKFFLSARIRPPDHTIYLTLN